MLQLKALFFFTIPLLFNTINGFEIEHLQSKQNEYFDEDVEMEREYNKVQNNLSPQKEW